MSQPLCEKKEKEKIIVQRFWSLQKVLLAQCNRPKPSLVCTSSLRFSRLYILMLWLNVIHVIYTHVMANMSNIYL